MQFAQKNDKNSIYYPIRFAIMETFSLTENDIMCYTCRKNGRLCYVV